MSVVGFDVGNDASCVAIARKVSGDVCAVPLLGSSSRASLQQLPPSSQHIM